MNRPLANVKVLDVSALGPGPFASMLLADYGADVVAVERPIAEAFDPSGFFARGKRSVVVDLRADGGSEVIQRLAAGADVFLESYRPGTMERRGLGPEVLLALNPRLIYVRLTGYGQHGPYANRAGHDINYLAVSGVLGAIGGEAPVPPLNLLGDFAGGSLNAVTGVLLALFERERTGRGQVIDAAMVDGAALLLTAQLGEHGAGLWAGRGRGVTSGAAPYYTAYQCSDGGWFAVGAIEARFYAQLVSALGLAEAELPDRDDPANWPQLRTRFAARFAARPRDHWTAVFADIDGCGSPVLDIGELAENPHLRERGTVQVCGSGQQTAPAPRLSDSPLPIPPERRERGGDTVAVLADTGFTAEQIRDLSARGVIPPI